MATITLSLKNPNAEKSQIWATISDGRTVNIKLYPGVTIKPNHWSKKSKTVLSANSQAVTLNTFLRSFENQALDIYLKAKADGIQANGDFIKKQMKPNEEVKPITFWDLWDMFLQSKKGIFQKASFKKFGSLVGHLKSFETHQKKSLDLDKVSQEQLEDFQTFLYNQRDLNTQSTSKYIGVYKIFLNWCVKRRFTANIDFRYFTPINQPDGLKVIASDTELDLLRNLNLGSNDYLSNVRELFLLSCLTGLRYSDYSRINKQHLKKDNKGNFYLQIRQQKTEDFVELPLTPEALTIVRKLIANTVHSISNQKMNSYVKELCKLAGIDEPFEKVSYKGRDKKIETVPKYELISTHTGRRTFATNLLNRGVPAEIVMNFTGHKDYKSFSKYVNIPKRTEMEIVRNALISDSYLRKVL